MEEYKGGKCDSQRPGPSSSFEVSIKYEPPCIDKGVVLECSRAREGAKLTEFVPVAVCSAEGSRFVDLFTSSLCLNSTDQLMRRYSCINETFEVHVDRPTVSARGRVGLLAKARNNAWAERAVLMWKNWPTSGQKRRPLSKVAVYHQWY